MYVSTTFGRIVVLSQVLSQSNELKDIKEIFHTDATAVRPDHEEMMELESEFRDVFSKWVGVLCGW